MAEDHDKQRAVLNDYSQKSGHDVSYYDGGKDIQSSPHEPEQVFDGDYGNKIVAKKTKRFKDDSLMPSAKGDDLYESNRLRVKNT